MNLGVRPRPTDPGPSDRLLDVLGLRDELVELARAGDGLQRRLEETVGLRTGELQALVAVAEGADGPAAVALGTGQVERAAGATVAALRWRGLLHGGDGSLALTEAGRAVLQQVEGLEIRLLDGVVRTLGDRSADRLRSTVRALGEALAIAPGEGPAALPGGP